MKAPVRKYNQWLGELKNDIHQSRLQTALQVNSGMLILYWYIGKQIIQKIEAEGWGAKIIEQLSVDLQKEFPDMKGFSVRNLLYMKQFAAVHDDLLITQQAAVLIKKSSKDLITQQAAALIKKDKNQMVQQPVVQFGNKTYYLSNALLVNIPWGQHMLLLDKINDNDERLWYINKTIENNWSRAVLQYQIETDLYLRQHKIKKASNFHLTLPKPQADLANQILKDPYIFRFPQMGGHVSERELEDHLIKHIQEFIMELDAGFAFAGRQVKFMTGKKEHFVDLLFYHLYLRSFVVIELKMDEFEMAHSGKMNGYLNMVNKQLRQPQDNPSIGIILCGAKDNVEVDYALTNINHPIGVSEYTFSKSLPKNLKNKLPSAKQLQDEVYRFLKKVNLNTNRSAKRKKLLGICKQMN